ncbi:2,3-diphosphoglycerate-dependent phosphoglycerate mutase [Facklamia hominis]|uniref:2,3-diphosphoglycerate-dependent phosphoglycerate mutase n=1 Tax=Facklamia hominis TaxID=178214 RepID=UPI00035411A9|nr:2,3-diphosphoglycerate-dependent phosphoglycerate mutase [Facklamia hominis]EPH11888.1 phosphoglycerate mutase 1 family protein [Facklamia hominis ACS-120-V-Sch10]PKY93481.1 2,3-diphosphoglycerate-dependent phosphoglycerate mutase [Facklamia hominis]
MKLILVRHGQSEWNQLNQFTGWEDVGLTEKGINEAKSAGHKLKEAGIDFDLAYTSRLKRAIKTLYYILDETDRLWVDVTKTWRLNERHYGALQGLNKKETAEKYGDEQVHIWRRSYDVCPPAMSADQAAKFLIDPRYANLAKDRIPLTENLKITLERVMPFYEDYIVPALLDDKNVLVAAHGNSLRALIKKIEGIADDEITSLEIATGIPIVYEFDTDLKVIDKKILDA